MAKRKPKNSNNTNAEVDGGGGSPLMPTGDAFGTSVLGNAWVGPSAGGRGDGARTWPRGTPPPSKAISVIPRYPYPNRGPVVMPPTVQVTPNKKKIKKGNGGYGVGSSGGV